MGIILKHPTIRAEAQKVIDLNLYATQVGNQLTSDGLSMNFLKLRVLPY